MSAKPAALLAPSVKPADALSFDPESPDVVCTHRATIDPDCDRAKEIRAECSGHIGDKALKHPKFNFDTDISVWQFKDGRIVWSSPVVRASNKKLIKPIERNGLPPAVIDAFKNGDSFHGLTLPSCASEEPRKAQRRKPTDPSGNAMPNTDALLDQLAKQAQNGIHVGDQAEFDADKIAAAIIQKTYSAYAGTQLSFLHAAARAGLFAHSGIDTPAGKLVAAKLDPANMPDVMKATTDWVKILNGMKPCDGGSYKQGEAFQMAAAAVYDVLPHLARAASEHVEEARRLAAADYAELCKENETYRKLNVELDLRNADLQEQLAAAQAAAASPAADADGKKNARKRSGGTPSGKRAAAASSAASAPALPEADAAADEEEMDM